MTVIVGVSGGADSVCLLRLMHSLSSSQDRPAKIVVAHYNHRLRGEASDEDESFVQSLALQLGLGFIGGRSEVSGGGEECLATRGSEEQWRRDRLDFFAAAAGKFGARYIVLGHHAEDRTETVLHNLLRGTGIAGLCSLKPFRSFADDWVLARPLLSTNRALIREYLKDVGQSYREDASNESGEFTRNRIRLELVPKLREMGFANCDSALIRLAEQANELQEWIDSLVDPLMEQLVQRRPDGFQLELSGLQQVAWPVMRTLLVRLWNQLGWPLGELSMTHWSRIRAVLAENNKGSDTKFHLPGGILISRCETHFMAQLLTQSNSR